MVELLQRLAAADLHRRGNGARIAALAQIGEDLHLDHLQRLDLHLGLRQSLDEAAFLDQPARSIGRLLPRDPLHVVEAGMEVRRIGIAAALELEQILGHGPAGVLGADPVGNRRADIVEEHLVDLVVSGQGQDRRD